MSRSVKGCSKSPFRECWRNRTHMSHETHASYSSLAQVGGETTGSGSKKLHLFAISADFLFSLFFSPFLSILVLLHGVESLEYPPVCVRRRGKMMSRCP